MDWDNVRGENPRPLAPPPLLHLIEERWRVVGPTGRIITCAVYGVEGPGVEVRAGYSAEEFQRTQRVADLEAARQLAGRWRQAAIAKGFTELSV
jgi:hypothetical protein